MSRYIDDILSVTILTTLETNTILNKLCKLLNLELFFNISKNNITIYLTIQLQTP
jgi:hypothetical protein